MTKLTGRALRALLVGAVFLAPSTGRGADGEIKIGAVLPVTGKESKIGGAYKQATEFAVKEVNDAGGLDPLPPAGGLAPGARASDAETLLARPPARQRAREPDRVTGRKA